MTTTVTSRQAPTVIEQAIADLEAAGYKVTVPLPVSMPITAHLHAGRYTATVTLCDDIFGAHVGLVRTVSGCSPQVLVNETGQLIDGRVVLLDTQRAVHSAVSMAAVITVAAGAGAQR